MIWNQYSLSAALEINIDFSVNGNQIQFNSNDVKEGDIFIALKGNGDGHDYVMQALENGASIAIIDKKIIGVAKNKAILVDHTFSALKKIAKYKRRMSNSIFIAITGSVGKTSTKEALKTVLSTFEPATFASRGNFNNYLGLLLNLASMQEDTKYAIFELGMNHEGEIRELSHIIKPHIAIITNISEAHLASFETQDKIVNAKCEIFEGLGKQGIAIINIDNDYQDQILSILKNLNIDNIYSFGIKDGASARFVSYKNLEKKVHCKFSISSTLIETTLPFIPEHYAQNYASVLMTTAILDKDIKLAANYLANISPVKGRGEIINVNTNQIICDYYNASPASMKASLKYLQQFKRKYKVAIIGEMLELGQKSSQLHEELVPHILEAECYKVFLVGSDTKYIYNLLPNSLIKKHFTNVDSLIQDLPHLIEKDEVILIKGSRAVKLDKIIKYL